jgi:ABC-type glycerol-3-phosphate transport system substrate-binding protein
MLNIAVGAGLLALAACGGKGDDALGDNAAEAAEAQADNLEAAADNATTEVQSDALEDRAGAVRDVGKAKEEAIDDADVNADAMSNQQKEEVVNGM